jgi:hypothetical protein
MESLLLFSCNIAVPKDVHGLLQNENLRPQQGGYHITTLLTFIVIYNPVGHQILIPLILSCCDTSFGATKSHTIKSLQQ